MDLRVEDLRVEDLRVDLKQVMVNTEMTVESRERGSIVEMILLRDFLLLLLHLQWVLEIRIEKKI